MIMKKKNIIKKMLVAFILQQRKVNGGNTMKNTMVAKIIASIMALIKNG